MSAEPKDQGATIKIGPKRSYTMVWDDYLVPGITARAWGYFCYLTGKPPGWEARVWDLINRFKEGRDAAYACLNELVDAGLMAKETYFEGNLRRVRYVLVDEVLNGLPLLQKPRSAPETDSQYAEPPHTEVPRAEVPRAENLTQVSKEVVITDLPITDPVLTAAAVASTGEAGTPSAGIDLFGVVDAEVVEDEPGEPDMDAERRKVVRTLVAAYVDVVTARGGHCTQSILASIGNNIRRVVRNDKIPEGVLLVAAQKAATRGERSLDRILAAPDGPQASWDRSPAARRAMEQSWLDMGRKLDEAAQRRSEGVA